MQGDGGSRHASESLSSQEGLARICLEGDASGPCTAQGGCHPLLCVQALQGSGLRGQKSLCRSEFQRDRASDVWAYKCVWACKCMCVVGHLCLEHIYGVVWGPLRQWVQIP